MDRLRPPPPRLPLRAWIFCVVLAVALLLRSGAPLLDALQLLAGILPLDQEGQTVAHVLLARSLKSFVLVSFALAAGLSFALAAAMLVSRLGGRASRLTGWLGGAFAYVPPMGWALGAIFFLIRVRHLPVETLFPFPPTSGDDSWTVVVARTLWAWLVPVLVLAVPVFGTALYSLTHRLSALLNNPKLFQLNARGLGHSQIVFRHLVPQLRVHLARLARPCAAMLLAYDVPVEELLGFNGWGRYVAGKLSEPGANTAALAGALWMAGWMLAGCLAWLGLLDKKGLPQLAEETRDSSQKRSWRAVVSGSLIAISLVKLPELAVYYSWWPSAAASHAAWADELQRAGMISSGALLLVLLCGPAMCLTRNWRWVLNRGVAASFGVVPL
ncbi:MAG: hypothetical protein WCN98_08325, partial [Verrucomicrobiaceae bacterium]